MSIDLDAIFNRLTLAAEPNASSSTSNSTTAVTVSNAELGPITDDPPPPYTPFEEIGLAIVTPEIPHPIGLGLTHAPHTLRHCEQHVRPLRPSNSITTLSAALRIVHTQLQNLQDELNTCKMQKESLHERLIEALDQRDALMAFLQEQEAELKRAKQENERLERERDALVIVLTPQKLVNGGPRLDSDEEHEAWRKARRLHHHHRVERNLRALGLV